MSDVIYENIVCEKSHNGKECSFSKRALTKVNMLILIAIFTVVTFSGCESIKKDVEQLTTTIPQTSYTQMMGETTTKVPITGEVIPTTVEEIIIQETIPATTEAVIQTTTNIETQENTTENEIQQDIITTSSVEQTTKQEVETTQKTEQTQNVDKEYDRLLEKLNSELSKKNFSKEVNQLFIDTFERLYKNYPTWQKGYKDLPCREDYIESNLISIIKNIDIVEFYKAGSKKAIELEADGYSSAWTTFDENRNLSLGIIAKEANKANEEERNIDIEKFYHEIIHCKQRYIMDYANNYFYGNEEVEQLYLEGGATFHMKFVNPFSLDVGAMWSIENERGNLIIDYNKDNGVGYLVDLNAYEKLVCLVGYAIMDKVEKGELPISSIEEAITRKYGKAQASKFLQTMKEWYTEYNNSYKGEKIYNLAIEFEKIFLECIKQDIRLLGTESEITEYKKIWEHYKTKNLPQVTEETRKNITNETFNIDSIDNMLNGKEQDNIKINNEGER